MHRFYSVAGSVALLAMTIGCGSGWRMHEERAVAGMKPALADAPVWVKGEIPQSEDRIYFVGRSHTPDMHKRAGSSGSTPDGRVGFTAMDERDAVQSARTDVYDQVRQRLQPRNLGTAGQVLTASADSGTCTGCGAEVALARTGSSACNDPCYSSPKNPWQDSSRSAQSCGGCGDAQRSTFASGGGTGGAPAIPTEAAPAVTLVDALTRRHRIPDYLPALRGEMARDLNLANIGIDSVMPALLAQLDEESVYFEKWNVHEGHDPFGRWTATGRDEWQSYKCWVLYSIPRAEFMRIAGDFRERYDELYAQAMAWMKSDRDRRIKWEDQVLSTQLKWQEQERSWNREDETIARDHAITIDKDREPMPGRRFRLVGSDH